MVKEKKIAVLGLGYVGLPLAVGLCSSYKTIGFDISLDRVSQLLKGIDKTLEVEETKLKNCLKRKLIVTNNFKDLESLPGVGHKTASVVMSQGFGIPAFAVDTHIHRLAQRWGLTNGTNVATTERDLKKIFPKDSWNKLHLQIIFWGREFCTARSCYRLECKICKTCYPNRKKPFMHKKP